VDYAKGTNFSPNAVVPKNDFIKLFSSRQSGETPKSPDQILRDKSNLE
jgi:hypothetical protein